MVNKDKFVSAISTLLFSWGGDTPPEAIWGVNELLDWYVVAYEVDFPDRFEEDGSNAAEVMEKLGGN